MNTGVKVFMLIISAIVAFMALFFTFPMILEGVDVINETTNVTQYYGLAEINMLSPAILFLLFILLIFGGFAWIFRVPIKRRFFGGE